MSNEHELASLTLQGHTYTFSAGQCKKLPTIRLLHTFQESPISRLFNSGKKRTRLVTLEDLESVGNVWHICVVHSPLDMLLIPKSIPTCPSVLPEQNKLCVTPWYAKHIGIGVSTGQYGVVYRWRHHKSPAKGILCLVFQMLHVRWHFPIFADKM